MSKSYRPDIDGLRALAVLSVVLFHAFPKAMRGGFVGVDVFFVISGFLITGIILEQTRAGKFGFIDFYVRRVRRIFPALLIVLTVTIATGWMVLLADEYARLGKHTAGGAAFVANMLFWNESGYFDPAADTKPLLHLWSLGIEEQYYLLWPVLIWAAAKKSINPLIPIVAVISVSFALNIAVTPEDSVAAFYSPLTRFWELAVGSALACTQRRLGIGQPSQIASWVGLLLVVIGFVATRKNGFPGWWPLLPVVGTALVIASPDSWLSRKFLSHWAMVGIGLISYPLYLWHWPLLSLGHFLSIDDPSVAFRAILVSVAVALAWLTARIERPVRFGPHGRQKATALCAAMTAVCAIGLTIAWTEGIPSRPIAQLTKHFSEASADWDYTPTTFADGKIGNLHILKGQSDDSVLFIGDSLMGQYFPRAKQLYQAQEKPYYSTIYASRNHCYPMPDNPLRSGPEGISCADYYRAALKLAHSPNVKRLVLSGGWRTAEDGSETVVRLIDDLVQLNSRGKEIFLVSRSPQSPRFGPHRLANVFRVDYLTTGTARPISFSVPRSEIESQDAAGQQMLSKIASRTNATFINPYDYFCPDGVCTIVRESEPLWNDPNHIRASFAKQKATFIDRIVNR